MLRYAWCIRCILRKSVWSFFRGSLSALKHTFLHSLLYLFSSFFAIRPWCITELTVIYKRTHLFAQIDWCDVWLEEHWRLEEEENEAKRKEMNIMCSNISRQLFNVTFCVEPRCSKCCPLLLFSLLSIVAVFRFRLDIIYYITWKWVKYMRTEINIGWIVCAYVRNEMIRCACA